MPLLSEWKNFHFTYFTFSFNFISHEHTVKESSPSEVFLGKAVLKICSKFTGEHPCRSGFSIKLLCNFIENALQHGCSPVSLLHTFKTPFPKNTSEGLLWKELNKLKSKKALQETDIHIKIIKKNVDVIPHFFYHNFKNSLLCSTFPTGVKYADL